MNKEKKYYRSLDIIRVVSCIAVLLYHLDILKGGYLAVCTFFVLSGYLSCVKEFRKEKFSLLKYYKDRFFHIYLPLLVVVFLTVFAISIFSDITWLNLKPETTSVLFGYNNFWQLGANLDYFTRSITSPFMHFWYIAILLQFDLVFPFIYIIFKKIGESFHKLITCELLVLLSIIGMIYFFRMSEEENIMIVYYDTFTRLFSLVLGLTVGFIHSFYKPFVISKNKMLNTFIFFVYLILLIISFFVVESDSNIFAIVMILVSLVTCRLIDYGTLVLNETKNVFDKILKYLASISYEVYLFQYPVIYLLSTFAFDKTTSIFIAILITFVCSVILHFAFKKNISNKVLLVTKYLVCVVILALSLLGFKDYVLAKDNSEEMRLLEDQLSQNEEMLKKKQEEYAQRMKEENDKWESMLSEIENGEEALKDVVANLPVVGIGDSVLLGATTSLYKQFPKGYFDGKVSRTDYELNPILLDLKSKNMLGDVVIINLGTNGDCKDRCKPEIIKTLKNKKVFWVNVTNDYQVHVNSRIEKIANENDNIYLVDWVEASKGHKEYFVADGIHLTYSGREAYTKTIYDEIYKVYLDEYNAKKEEILKKHEEEEKNKITFIGNDLILNSLNKLSTTFDSAKFVTDKDYTFDSLKKEIQSSIDNNTLTYRVVFGFDNSLRLSDSKIKELVSLCEDHDIYFVLTDSNIKNIDGATYIKFYEDINSNLDYLMVDKIHLSEKGNTALSDKLNEVLNKIDEN